MHDRYKKKKKRKKKVSSTISENKKRRNLLRSDDINIICKARDPNGIGLDSRNTETEFESNSEFMKFMDRRANVI